MASNPLFIIPDFFRIFQTNFAMAILGLKEIGKFFWESREKVLLILGLDAMPLTLKNLLLKVLLGH